MNAAGKRAALCFLSLVAWALPAPAELNETFKWAHPAKTEPIYNTIAADYSMNSTRSLPQAHSTTPAPEAATMLLCGAGILMIFAGMGVRRSAEQKSRK